MVETAFLLSNETYSMENNLKNIELNGIALKNLSYTNSDPNYNIEIYNFAKIKEENEKIFNSSKNFDDNILKVKNVRMNYEFGVVFGISLLTLVAYICIYFILILVYKYRFPKVVSGLSILIYLILIPNCLLIAYNMSLWSVSIDFCQDVNFDLTNNIGPIMDMGYGIVKACPSKVTICLT